MRIGIVKPDYGIVGVFELLLGRLERELEASGHTVEHRPVRVAGVGRRPFGLAVPDPVWDRAWEAFRYFALLDSFTRLDVSGLDLVLSTQPPSFAVDHPHQLSLFLHHLRVYYELSDVYVAAGFVDPDVHAAAERAVRRADTHFIDRVTRFLACGAEVEGRLARFHDLGDRVDVCYPGSELAEDVLACVPADRFEHVLCVTRHEFPKRAELFVHAMKLLPSLEGVCTGTGGRLEFARALDARLSRATVDLDAIPPTELWLNRGEITAPVAGPERSNVRFTGHVSDDELAGLYGSCLCVVAPAYQEDYGLTAIEAMRCGKPLVVCNDGGGLARFVDDGDNGFVVEPTGPAIAAAVGRLAADPHLARAMGARGRERATRLTWRSAMPAIEAAIEAACG